MVDMRGDVIEGLRTLALLTTDENYVIVSRAHELLDPIAQERNAAFMREVGATVGNFDYAFLIDFVLGSPMLGSAPPAPTMLPRMSPPTCTI